MSWKIRHQGSPRSIEGLNLTQVIEGLQDGLWDPTDEIKGPHDAEWTPIESHPELAELAADLEPPPPKFHDDETRLDMNPLIDVALVLLIFFILTTSYSALLKMVDVPGTSSRNVNKPLVRVPQAKVNELMIKVEARTEDGKKVIRVEDEVVEERYLRTALTKYVSQTRKTNLLLDAKGVDLGTVVAIQDAAKGAGLQMIYYPKPPSTPANSP
jgi:biopolymer transport protein ExbD